MSNSVKDTLQNIIAAHGTDVVEKNKFNLLKAFDLLKSHIKGFQTNYNKFYIQATKVGEGQFDSEIQGYIQKLVMLDNDSSSRMSGARYEKEVEFNRLSVATIRSIFIKIRDRLNSQEIKNKMPHEMIRSTNNEIMEVFRFTRLISLYHLENEAYEMINLDIEEFKQALHSGAYDPVSESINVVACLRDAIQNLQEYAERRQIDIVVKLPINIINVWADERNLYLAFYNIINNAIKYSFIKPDDKKSIVRIEIIEDPMWIIINFENRGLGIVQEEIDSGSIWGFGQRGLKSKDRKRRGNGIGLWHTKKIVTEFKGEISISSKPIDPNYPDDFKRPFITKLTIKLKNQKRNG
jgi:signal transduction histidine kinase